MRRFHILFALALIFSLPTLAQTFSSGSTGADGALDLTSGDKDLQLPDSGILNLTTVNIPAGRTLTFKSNSRNTPVIMLAQGAVTIRGNVYLDGNGRLPGPGGFAGGDGGTAGFGPAGGQPIAGQRNAQWAGPLSLVPIIGGSGGAGCGNPGTASYGGGGGGAIAIASSSSISIDGYMSASKGVTGCSYGADGPIRLVANSINVGGSLTAAIVRFEAPTGSIVYTGTGTSPVIASINPKITPTNLPSLTIVSVGGYPVPSSAGFSFTTADLLFPTSIPDPMAVVVQANNVPVGTPVLIAFSGSPNATYTPASLTGTNATSTATLNVSGMNRSIQTTYLYVMVSFDPALIAGNLKQTGPDVVQRVELASSPGGPTRFRFLRKDGSEIAKQKVVPELRLALGM